MIKKLIYKLENIQINFYQWIMTFFCIVILRVFLDTLAYGGSKIYDFDLVFIAISIHGPLYFFSVILSLILALYLLTREEILKISKIILPFFMLILLAPIFDIIISGGKRTFITYIRSGDLFFLANKFLTFMSNISNVSLGIKIEMFIGCILASIYSYIKTKSYFRTVFTAFFIYLIVFLYYSIPAVINLFSFFQFQYRDHTIVSFFIFFIIIQLLLWFYFWDKNKFISVVKNIRIFRVTHYWFMLLFGFFLGTKIFFLQSMSGHYLNLSLALCSVLFAWMFAVGINDIADKDIDKISNINRPLVKKTLSLQEFKNLNIVYFILSLLSASCISHFFFMLILAYQCLYFVYSVPPLRLKRFLIISKLIIACASLVIMMSGFLLVSPDQSLSQFPKEFVFLVLICFTLAINFIDIKDEMGDKKGGICTILTLLGERIGKKVVGFLVFIAYGLSPLLIHKYELLPCGLLFGLINFFLINRKKVDEGPIFITYYIALVLLIINLNK